MDHTAFIDIDGALELDYSTAAIVIENLNEANETIPSVPKKVYLILTTDLYLRNRR
jgi:hypothetical protein